MSKSVFLTKEMLLEQKDALAIEKVELKDSKGEKHLGIVFNKGFT